MNAIKNITIGHTERLYKPVGYTMLVNLVNIIPFCLSIEAVRIIFAAFDGSGRPLDTARLWCIFGILAVYMLVMALAERTSYRANFRGAYEMSASGRIALAEHLRKLSLGFLSRRDPGDLSSMLVTDFTMAETGISHHLPQLMGAVVMPVLAFLSLVWIDWRMAVAMFAALPVAILVLWMSTSVQKRLSGKQIQAKINAGNRLEEYLQGIRVMKAYNLLGDRFVRLRDAFAELRRACIRQEALLGPFVLLCITLVRAGLTLMVLCGTYLLLGGELSLLVFVLFLVVGSRVFDPLTSALTNFAEFRYFSIAGGRILTLMNEPEMEGERQAPVTGDIRFEHVSFAYQDKTVLQDVSIAFSKNTLTALVGPSGSGKSTVMKLCARFYDPQQGRVLFDSVPMKDIEPESLMSRISMVFQDVYLFQDTIRDNIRFGKPGATDEEVIAAAEKACCHGRRRLHALRRREAAHIHRPRHPEGCADHPAGRSDRIARPGKRGGGAESHRHAYRGTHRHRHRPQAQDDYECGPDRRSGRRTGKGAGHARRADAARGALCPSVDDSGEIRRLDRIE